LFFTCGQNSAEKKLNGKWYAVENDGYTRIHFYPDSLVFTEEYKESVKWNATDSRIDFNLPSNMFMDSIKDVSILYRLSTNKDTIYGAFKNVHGERKITLLRADNYIEYLNKRYDIKFSLPKDNSVKNLNYFLKNSLNRMYGLKIFIGLSDKEFIAKTELSENLNNLESDIKTFKARIEPSQHPLNYYREILDDDHINLLDNRFHFRVFADKNISDEMITKYLSININGDNSFYKRIQMKTPDSIPIKIFRIYDNKEMEKDTGIRGKQIKTIANTVYN
jgi:hypothetical protein